MALDENLFLGLVVYGGVVLAVFWLAMIIWAYRDMRARSRDTLAQIFVGLVIAVLNIPGLFIYIMLRPRETLAESYERSLEEEALLQEIEEKPTCPGCSQRVLLDWQACPSCHTRLKKPCIACSKLLELSWNLCPYCATSQVTYQPDEFSVRSSSHVRPPQQVEIGEQWLSKPKGDPPARRRTTESLEFVESDDY